MKRKKLLPNSQTCVLDTTAFNTAISTQMSQLYCGHMDWLLPHLPWALVTFLLQYTSLHLSLTSASSKYYVLTDIRLWEAGRHYNSSYFSQGTVVLNKMSKEVLSILRAIILTVKPLELFSSKVDLAYAALRVSFRMSNGGGLMYIMYGFSCGIRSIFKAYKQKDKILSLCKLYKVQHKTNVDSRTDLVMRIQDADISCIH